MANIYPVIEADVSKRATKKTGTTLTGNISPP